MYVQYKYDLKGHYNIYIYIIYIYVYIVCIYCWALTSYCAIYLMIPWYLGAKCARGTWPKDRLRLTTVPRRCSRDDSEWFDVVIDVATLAQTYQWCRIWTHLCQWTQEGNGCSSQHIYPNDSNYGIWWAKLWII